MALEDSSGMVLVIGWWTGSVRVDQVAAVVEEGDSWNWLQWMQDLTVAAKALKVSGRRVSGLSVDSSSPPRPQKLMCFVVVCYELAWIVDRLDKTDLFLGEGFVCPILILCMASWSSSHYTIYQ